MQEWDGMVRLCFNRKNKTLGAIFKNKKTIELLEQNYRTFCALNNQVAVCGVSHKQIPEERDMKDAVLAVLEESGRSSLVVRCSWSDRIASCEDDDRRPFEVGEMG